VRVQAPYVVDDEALQRADVLDLLDRQDIETHGSDPRGDPHGVFRILALDQATHERAESVARGVGELVQGLDRVVAGGDGLDLPLEVVLGFSGILLGIVLWAIAMIWYRSQMP
jgi:hypothetical protein